MLEVVSKGFKAARLKLQGQAELSENSISDAIRDVRLALLEADVEFGVVKQFIEKVRSQSIGKIVQTSASHQGQKKKISPSDQFIAICQEELENLMGPVDTNINFNEKGPTGIMMIGLQGSGKTTTTGKLAKYLLEMKKKVLLVAADIYRPAAVEQLKTLAKQLGVEAFFQENTKPPELCTAALSYANEHGHHVVIFDTAGRLAIDEELMNELTSIKNQCHPHNIFLVCDSMIGQDAVNTAKTFHEKMDITGFILTKLDGDARGGAALSIKAVTGRPIKFLGMGETLEKLEEFRPEGLASRILGMGDIVGLVKDFEKVIDEKKAEEEAEKLLKGQFSLVDFIEQIRMIRKMGSLSSMVEKMPFMSDMLPEGFTPNEKEFVRIEAMYNSMTKKERIKPAIIDNSRAVRIARGSGTQAIDVKQFLEKYNMMQKMMGMIGNNPGLLGKIPGLSQLAQMRKLRGMNMSELFGQKHDPKFEKLFRHDQNSSSLARPQPKILSADEKRKLKNKKKAAKQSKKKNRNK